MFSIKALLRILLIILLALLLNGAFHIYSTVVYTLPELYRAHQVQRQIDNLLLELLGIRADSRISDGSNPPIQLPEWDRFEQTLSLATDLQQCSEALSKQKPNWLKFQNGEMQDNNQEAPGKSLATDEGFDDRVQLADRLIDQTRSILDELGRLEANESTKGAVLIAITIALGLIFVFRPSYVFSGEAGRNIAIFRTLVEFNQILIFGVVVIQVFTHGIYRKTSLLEESSRIYASSTASTLLIILPIISVLATLGLLLFRDWGKKVFIVFLALWLLVTAFNGYYLYTMWALVLSALSIITGTLTLILANRSPSDNQLA